MSSYLFKELIPLKGSDELKNGFYLWILHADKIPPHIGCSVNGQYFSLKANGKDTNLNFSKVLSLIDLKSISAVIVKLKSEHSYNDVLQIFSNYDCAEPEGNTCLTPIADLLNCKNEVEQLSELLKLLENRNDLDFNFGLNLTDTYHKLPEYSKIDIENRLHHLRNAKIRKNIPAIG